MMVDFGGENEFPLPTRSKHLEWMCRLITSQPSPRTCATAKVDQKMDDRCQLSSSFLTHVKTLCWPLPITKHTKIFCKEGGKAQGEGKAEGKGQGWLITGKIYLFFLVIWHKQNI